MTAKEQRREKVRLFDSLCAKAGFDELAPHVFERTGQFPKTLTLCTLVHGNEVGGIEVFLRLLESIISGDLQLRSNLRLMLGNVEAYYEDVRYIETDMNRSFGLTKPVTREEKRAKDLEEFLADTDVFIDVHQTIGPTSTPFFIFEFDEKSYQFARSLHETLPVVMNSLDRPFPGKTSTGFVISKGGLGIAVETGQKGIDSRQLSLGLHLTQKACEGSLDEPHVASPFTDAYLFHQIIDNPDGTLELVKTFKNFDQVNLHEVLARNSEKEIRSETDGVILFPKYGNFARVTRELALILKPLR